MLGGVAAFAGAFLPAMPVRMAVMIAALAMPALVSVVYSYLVSRRLKLS